MMSIFEALNAALDAGGVHVGPAGKVAELASRLAASDGWTVSEDDVGWHCCFGGRSFVLASS